MKGKNAGAAAIARARKKQFEKVAEQFSRVILKTLYVQAGQGPKGPLPPEASEDDKASVKPPIPPWPKVIKARVTIEFE